MAINYIIETFRNKSEFIKRHLRYEHFIENPCFGRFKGRYDKKIENFFHTLVLMFRH